MVSEPRTRPHLIFTGETKGLHIADFGTRHRKSKRQIAVATSTMGPPVSWLPRFFRTRAQHTCDTWNSETKKMKKNNMIAEFSLVKTRQMWTTIRSPSHRRSLGPNEYIAEFIFDGRQ